MKHFKETEKTIKLNGKRIKSVTRFFETPEDTDPKDSFEFQEDIDNINNGKYSWVSVKVETTLSLMGEIVGVGADHLGCVSYKDYTDLSEVISSHGMQENAESEAIKDLQNKALVYKELL